MQTVTEEFIVACLREDSPEKLGEFLARGSSRGPEIDWALILSNGYRIAPTIYFMAKRACPDFPVPREIAEEMPRQYFRTFASNVELRRLVCELALEFNREKIEIVYLKGAALLATVYKENPGLRFIGDVDVLVRKKDVPAAKALLERLGYVETKDQEGVSGPKTRHAFHDRYYKKPVDLELHWDIDFVENPQMMERFFLSSRTAALEEGEIRILSPEGSLLMACINFARDVGGALWQPFELDPVRRRRSSFYEVVPLFLEIKKMAVFYGPDFHWDLFLSLAKSSGRARQIAILLILAEKIVEADIPAHVLRKIKSDFLVSLNMLLLGQDREDDLAPLFSIEGTLKDLWRRACLCFQERTPLKVLMNRYIKRSDGGPV